MDLARPTVKTNHKAVACFALRGFSTGRGSPNSQAAHNSAAGVLLRQHARYGNYRAHSALEPKRIVLGKT